MNISRRMLIVGVVTLALVLVGAISLMVALGGSPATAKVAAQVPVTVTVTPTPTVDVPTETETSQVPTGGPTTSTTPPVPAPTLTVVVTQTVTAPPPKKPAAKSTPRVPTQQPTLATPTPKLGEIYRKDGRLCVNEVSNFDVDFTLCAKADPATLRTLVGYEMNLVSPFVCGMGLPPVLVQQYDVQVVCI